MKIYLVGGAVRDKLLNIPFNEKDFVVVGGTPEEMLKLGYKKVGKDFPVFLHPETQEEYALARTERKTKPGYFGFECDFSKEVTLEEDLQRRDLTINAMALDDNGKIIDPYGGQKDLKNKVLRHISPAFIEDPVRVLRVARFLARFHYLGFTIAPDTMSLMYQMVSSGELNYLVKERIWQEFNSSLQERNPEMFILTLRQCAALNVVMPELNKLFGIPCLSEFNIGKDAGVRSLEALKNSQIEALPLEARFAALLHCLPVGILGYEFWPINLKSFDARENITPVEKLCDNVKSPQVFKKLAINVARFHASIDQFYSLTAEEIVDILSETDAFRRPYIFENILNAYSAIYMAQPRTKEIKNYWQQVMLLCSQISPTELIEQGLKKNAIKEGLRNLRIESVTNYLNNIEKL